MLPEEFLEMTEAQAMKRGVTTLFHNGTHVRYPSTGALVNGYFIEKPVCTLAVAIGKPAAEWLPVVAHESSHMDQSIESTKVWNDRLVPGTEYEAADLVLLWVDRKIGLSRKQLDEYVRRARNMELDCERRVVQKISRFSLPIGYREYAQRANSYIFFYTALKYLRSWYIPGKEPYNVDDVWTRMPKEFLRDDEYENVPEDIMEAFRKII